MKEFVLERAQLVPNPLHEVFAFFSRPENLADLTPGGMAFKILTPAPVEMKAGALIDYAIKIAGLNVRWTTLITHYDPPNQFIDQQLKGPYDFWHHTHTFRQTPGGTMIGDKVIYKLPWGIIGQIAHGLYVKRQLNKIFDYRAEVISRIFTAEILPGERS